MATQPQMLLSIGERILLLRRRNDLTIEKLSRATGITWTFIGKIERGQAKNPGASVLAKLATALNTSVDFLVGLTDDPRPYTEREKPSKRSRQRNARQNARSSRPIQRPLAAAVR